MKVHPAMCVKAKTKDKVSSAGGWGLGMERRGEMPRDVKNEDRPDYVYENTAVSDKVSNHYSGICAQ
jgi:hypothetical protein